MIWAEGEQAAAMVGMEGSGSVDYFIFSLMHFKKKCTTNRKSLKSPGVYVTSFVRHWCNDLTPGSEVRLLRLESITWLIAWQTFCKLLYFLKFIFLCLDNEEANSFLIALLEVFKRMMYLQYLAQYLVNNK